MKNEKWGCPLWFADLHSQGCQNDTMTVISHISQRKWLCWLRKMFPPAGSRFGGYHQQLKFQSCKLSVFDWILCKARWRIWRRPESWEDSRHFSLEFSWLRPSREQHVPTPFWLYFIASIPPIQRDKSTWHGNRIAKIQKDKIKICQSQQDWTQPEKSSRKVQ
jgi:hypothetical protein